MRKHLFNTEKIKYIKGKKPDVECILCAIKEGHPDVESPVLGETDNFIISLNLYPFNPGHLMIFPKRHIEKFEELNDSEAVEMHRCLCHVIDILNREFNPVGFNIGFNLGENSGASIKHIHQHVVPRYMNEVGFLDVLAGTRVFVMDPADVLKRLKERWSL